MRDREEFVLSFHEVLYVWFVVLLERLAYDVPADEVIPARTFECELAWTFYILEVFQNLILVMVSRSPGTWTLSRTWFMYLIAFGVSPLSFRHSA